ncbi:GNAT family N-acetyltransferase [Pseudomonas sp. PDM22]|uniref:GNAT family N-acetyltransferase n=1 Tax=Pseudomonas sp. PDM22 TaxID=2769287 RepID=UPI00177EE357|nr:GNAT family N-acetyltransferase [Pseudomonas sp. PDM22]MBD9516141.1 GNAT family N-acetyltransferase [Pseudomonas sp. PDM22]
MKKSASRHYPRRLELNGTAVEFRLMTAEDGPALNQFMAELPVHDLLFVRRNISHPKVIKAWLEALGKSVSSLVAYANGQLVGCTAVVVDSCSWSPHVGDLRILVAPAWRGRGLGRVLIKECVNLALSQGLEKLTVQMTVDQSAAITTFEGLGFQPESVLRNHVKDHDGRTYDLALLSLEVKELAARASGKGMATAISD